MGAQNLGARSTSAPGSKAKGAVNVYTLALGKHKAKIATAETRNAKIGYGIER
jgi:hypothetical protein